MISPSCIDALIQPRSVAVVGASTQSSKLTARLQLFLAQHGFDGRVHPVNPSAESVLGLHSHKSVEEIGEPVDHAYILVGTEHVLSAFADCVAAAVRTVSIMADGFAEPGPQEKERQDRLIARRASCLSPQFHGRCRDAERICLHELCRFKTERLEMGRLAVLARGRRGTRLSNLRILR